MLLHILLYSALTASLVSAKATVYLIRHGEKPDSGNGLTAQGQQRAQCLRNVFGKSSSYNIGKIMAQTPQSGMLFASFFLTSSRDLLIELQMAPREDPMLRSILYRRTLASPSIYPASATIRNVWIKWWITIQAREISLSAGSIKLSLILLRLWATKMLLHIQVISEFSFACCWPSFRIANVLKLQLHLDRSKPI